MKYHLIAFLTGFILDQIIGDPMNFPHPVRLIGSLISLLEGRLNPASGAGHFTPGVKCTTEVSEHPENPLNSRFRSGVECTPRGHFTSGVKCTHREAFRNGVLLCIAVLASTVAVTEIVMFTAYRIHPFAGVAAEAVLTCYILAAKSLQTESMKVYDALREGGTEKAREAVSMIVGRDTQCLDEQGIIRAAVETVAENTSDGVIAPLIYTFLGGPVAGFAYKAINTMDSMVGYHNERYEYFGRAAARLDDAVNFLPARISALLMISAAFLLERSSGARGARREDQNRAGASGARRREYSASDALRIFLRDRYNHKSPNSAQTESACAGALQVRLAGDAYYFGKLVRKPYIGDDMRPVEAEDIKRACRLMMTTAYLCAALLCAAGCFML